VPVVLVHGVPETAGLWAPLRGALSRADVVAVSLPGFSNPRPSGFGATKDEYVTWLIGELERQGALGPVDLVGHDWGGGLVARAVSLRPELVRTWASDAVGIASAAFTWHDLARIWQTPGEGEAFFTQLLGQAPEERAAGFEALGVPHDDALDLGRGLDQTMADCILDLYRSAVDVGREWASRFSEIPAPGLALVATEDPFGSAEVTRAAAAQAGARTATLEGAGHWWMLQQPAAAAAILEGFWDAP